MRGGPGRTIVDAVSDDFERASLGGTWTNYNGTADIIGSAAWGAPSSAPVYICGYTATTPGANQVVEAAIVSAQSTSLMEVQIFGRRRSSDSARYAFHYHAADEQWEIKYDGVATEDTRILDFDAVTPPPVAGSVLRMEIRGTGSTVNIRGYHNGLLLCEADDTDADRITATGPTGLVCRAQLGETPSYPVAVFSRFAAGTLLT